MPNPFSFVITPRDDGKFSILVQYKPERGRFKDIVSFPLYDTFQQAADACAEWYATYKNHRFEEDAEDS
jgi:hypothetical protein